jgi:hypothetical protein
MIVGYWLAMAWQTIRQWMCHHDEMVRVRDIHTRAYYVTCWRCGYRETWPTLSRRKVRL